MKIAPTPQTQLVPASVAPSESHHSTEAAFGDFLQAFDVAGKQRVEADIAEKTEAFDAVAWMLRVRAGHLYHDARHDLMAERNLDHHDLDAMSEDERMAFETQIYARVRDELMARMGRHHHCHCDEGDLRLFSLGPFLMR